jgi:predicted Zn-dependent protease
MTRTKTFLIGLLGIALAIGLGVSVSQGQEKEKKKKGFQLFEKGLQLFQALQPIGYEEELALGGAVAIEVFQRFGGPYEDPKVLKYVNLVGNSVAQFCDRPNIPYHFAVLNSEQPNAFAAPGGYIFVTIGLLKSVRNEAELAGVLGHEIAHVSEKHALEAIQRGKTLKGIGEFSLTVMNKDPGLFAGVIGELTEMLFTRGLDRNMEYEADRIGTEYASRVGYSSMGLRDFLNTLKREEGHVASIFFQTHPPVDTRVSRLDREVLPFFEDGSQGVFLQKRYAEWVSY